MISVPARLAPALHRAAALAFVAAALLVVPRASADCARPAFRSTGQLSQAANDDLVLAMALDSIAVYCASTSGSFCVDARERCRAAAQRVSQGQDAHDEISFESDMKTPIGGQYFDLDPEVGLEPDQLHDCEASPADARVQSQNRSHIQQRHRLVIYEYTRWQRWANGRTCASPTPPPQERDDHDEQPTPPPAPQPPTTIIIQDGGSTLADDVAVIRETRRIEGDGDFEVTHYEEPGTPPDFQFGKRKTNAFYPGMGWTSTDFTGTYFSSRIPLQHFQWFRRPYDLGIEYALRFDFGYHSYELGAKPAYDTIFEIGSDVRLWYRMFGLGAYAQWRAANYDGASDRVLLPGISAAVALPGAARAGLSIVATVRYSPAVDLGSPLHSVELLATLHLFHISYERHAVALVGDGIGIANTVIGGVGFGF